MRSFVVVASLVLELVGGRGVQNDSPLSHIRFRNHLRFLKESGHIKSHVLVSRLKNAVHWVNI